MNRIATINDVPQIMQLVAGIIPGLHAIGNFQWDEQYPTAVDFENDIALQELWVAEAGGSITGVIAVTAIQYPEYDQADWDVNQPALVIHRMAVDAAQQGKGIAAALVQHAAAIAKSRGISFIRADTHSINQAAQGLFLKLGYRFAGQITLHFRPALSFYCYEKQVD